jgi:hypothetical protein
MSLSSHLDDPTSPIGQFIKQRFARTSRLTKAVNQQLKSADTIRPVNADNSYPYGLIGTAIDYRIRYAFAITPYQRLVAWKGALKLAIKPPVSDDDILLDWIDLKGLTLPPAVLETGVAQGPYALSLIRAFFYQLENVLNTIQPKGRRLEREHERALDRYCIVLSLFEQVFRSNAYLRGPLMNPTVKNSVEELLALSQEACIDDLGELFARFYDRYASLLSKPCILNPTFAGSIDIGGADADFIVDGCLIDIKTSVHSQIKAEYLYQLAGYLLLDYDDYYAFDSVGIYMARQGLLFHWPVSEFVSELTGDNTHSLASLRQEFRALFQNV